MNTTRPKVAHFGLHPVKPAPRLNLNEILVFGSTLNGQYYTPGERIAHRDFGAPYEIPEGLAGCCYALPVRTEPRHYRPLADIEASIDRMFLVAAKNALWHFLVPVLTEHCRYTDEALARVFLDRAIPDNVYLPPEYIKFSNLHTVPGSINYDAPCPVCLQPVSAHGLTSVAYPGGPYHRLCTGELVKPCLTPQELPA